MYSLVRQSTLYVLLMLLLIALPTVVGAQEGGFTTLVGIPGVDANETDIGAYANALYTLAIGLAAVLAVGKIILAGVQFMFSDIVTSREQAKKDMQGALLGLLIILAAVTILNTINPNLTNLDVFQSAPQSSSAGAGGTGEGARQATSWQRVVTPGEVAGQRQRCESEGGTFSERGAAGGRIVSCAHSSRSSVGTVSEGSATIHDGAVGDMGAGPHHGETVQLLEPAGSGGQVTGYRVRFEDGTEGFVGCQLLNPTPNGC